MLNTFNINLNVDKSIREVTPPLVHRVGDPSGLTIIATIKQGKKLVSVAGSATLVCNFEDQTKLELACKASGNTITVTFNDSFKDHYGFVSCYFVLSGGYTTSVFKVKCIPNIEYTDDDLVWGNANFEGKISGSLKENPNILARYKDSYSEEYVSATGTYFPKWYVSGNAFDDSAESYEVDQNHYDALYHNLYGAIGNDGMSNGDSNFLSNDPVDGHATIDYTNPRGDIKHVQKTRFYPMFARFKVPKNTKTITINGLYRSKYMPPNSSKLTLLDNYYFQIPMLAVWNNDNSADYCQFTTDKTWSKDPQKIVSDFPGTKPVEMYQKTVTRLQIDCSKLNVIDKYGYVDLIIFRGSNIVKPMYSVLSYPHVNIDYGYLDLS